MRLALADDKWLSSVGIQVDPAEDAEDIWTFGHGQWWLTEGIALTLALHGCQELRALLSATTAE